MGETRDLNPRKDKVLRTDFVDFHREPNLDKKSSFSDSIHQQASSR
jgi:hypothetical protein